MNLPHLPPILFAQDVIAKEENSVQVVCKFDKKPTLGMFVEAAAQSSAAFEKTHKQTKGFVIGVKEVELLNDSDDLEVVVHLNKEIEMGTIFEFYFCAYTHKKLPLANGTITLLISED